MPERLKGAVCKTAREISRRFESDLRFKKSVMNEKEKTIKKWEDLGFLDGLKGLIKPEIAALFESQPSTLLNKSIMNENDVKKDLYKSKNMAKFSHYVSGNLYYRVELADGVYQFPIATVEFNEDGSTFNIGRLELSADLGQTSFEAEIKGSDLNRWIAKAIKTDEFIKVG
jgi:hypothetical protein